MEERQQAFVQKLQRDLNCISDPDRSTRRRAIERLQKRLLSGEPGEGPPPPELLQAAWDDTILQFVLRSLSDPVEKCRELGTILITSVVRALPMVERTLCLVISIVAERMGQNPVLEESEEIRLLLVQLIFTIFSAEYPSDAFQSVAEPLVKFFISALSDPFHEIKKGVCNAVVLVSERAPDLLNKRTEDLAKAVLPNVTHTHSRVRVGALLALDKVVMNGLPAGTLSDLIAPAVKPLPFDRSVSVREVFFGSVARWLGYDGNYTAGKKMIVLPTYENDRTVHIPHLLPLLLLGITDESKELAASSLHLVEEVGYLYEKSVFLRSPSSVRMQDGEDPGMTRDCMNTERKDDVGIVSDFPFFLLGVPYNERPSSGSRRMVQDNLKELLESTTPDLSEWKTSDRIGAARLASTILVFAEDHAHDCLDVLLPALTSAVSDEDVVVAQQLIVAVQVLGHYTRAECWAPFVLDTLSNNRTSDATKANVLVVLAGLLFGASKTLVPTSWVARLTEGLSHTDVRGSDHPAVRRQLLSVLTNLLNVAESLSTPSALSLFLTLLQLQSTEEDGLLQLKAGANIKVLAEKAGFDSVRKLYSNFMDDLIPLVTAGYENWIGASPGKALFQTFVRKSGGTVGPHLKTVVKMFSDCLHPDRDDALRLSFLQLLDELFENDELRPWWLTMSGQIILELLIPSGVWRIGKVAAAIRYRAMVALGTFLRQDLCPQGLMLELLKPKVQFLSVVLSCLDEDYYVDTRRATCHVVQHVIRIAGEPMADDHRRTLSREMQKRLDDSNDAVRLGIVPAIGAFSRQCQLHPVMRT